MLRAVSAGRSDLPTALAQVRGRLNDERDRALAGEIATGTLRWQGAFDVIIEAFAKRPAARLDAEVLDILRMTAFQLLHLDRIPASAAVNDAVALTGKAGKKSAAGLVNAVLRRISRERDRLPAAAAPRFCGRRRRVGYLEKTLSHPGWLAARWLDRYGFEAAEQWETFNNAPAALTLRANTLRIVARCAGRAAESLSASKPSRTRFALHGLTVRKRESAADAAAADEGVFIVQDESSQLVAELAGAAPGERILDACASPGGKTTAMAAAMGDRGLIVATDVRGRRVDLLHRTIKTMRGNIAYASSRRTRPECCRFQPRFDCVLLDAPCSGLGTLRRDPDIRWRRSADELTAARGHADGDADARR